MPKFTKIISNGSKWAGEEPDSIEKLLEVMKTEPLDRTFEQYGDFCISMPNTDGALRFWGNFHAVSHVFSIETNDPEVIESLIGAIKANKRLPGYLDQDRPQPRKKR